MKQKTLLLICSCLLTINLQAAIRYVKTDGITPAEDAANATSWVTACNDLQAVINASEAGDEVWVAVGTYKPNRPSNNLNIIDSTNRNNSFVLASNVAIYGGFPADADENTTMNDRVLPSLENRGSILSGDIDNDGTFEGNSSRVVVSEGNVGTASIDGFTITGGNADRSTGGTDGGGMRNISSSPIMKNLLITENRADRNGGGMYNNNASPFLSNVSIINNNGGGMSNISSFPILFNVSIINNTTLYTGGGIDNSNSSPTLINVLIDGNIAGNGVGGIFNGEDSNPILINVTISKHFGGGLLNYNSSPTIYNSIIMWNNGLGDYRSSPTYFHSLVQNVTTPDENGNLDGTLDPLFVNTEEGDFRLSEKSPCIDAGNKEIYLSTRKLLNFDGEKDLAGNERLFGANIDLGACEFFSQEPTNIHVVNGQKQSITSYPNPAVNGETVTLQLNETRKNGNWMLFHLNGNVIRTGKFENQQEIKIHTADLASGFYLVKLSGENWQTTEMMIVR